MRALTPNGTAGGAVVAMPKRTRFANTRSGFDYLIVGAGFAGSVLAERLAMYQRLRAEAELAGTATGHDAFHLSYIRFVAMMQEGSLGGARFSARK